MVKERDVFAKAWKLADEKLRLQFSFYYKKGSRWILVSKNGSWKKGTKYRWSCNLKRLNKSYGWKNVRVTFQSTSKIQLYTNSRYSIKTREQNKTFRLITDGKLYWCGYGYFTVPKNYPGNRTFLGGFIRADPILPTPMVPWAVKKKKPTHP